MYIVQSPLFDFEALIKEKGNKNLMIVLEALDAEKLISTLEREHWTGRKGYSVRGMWSALICGVVRQCETLAEVVRLLERDKEVRMVCGFPGKDEIPGEDALGRFLKKLVKHEKLVEEIFEGLIEKLRKLLPGFGLKLAVDSTDIEAYSNGHRTHKSDPDVQWGAKGSKDNHSGGEKDKKEKDLYWWFGYKLHLLVDAIYELPVTFMITPANESDTRQLKPLLEKARIDRPEAKPEDIIGDKGYDSGQNNKLIYDTYGAAPIIPIKERKGAQLPDICNAKGTPICGCGLGMVFWGRDGNYLKYRCPHVLGKGVCKSLSRCTASSYGYVLKLPIKDDPPGIHQCHGKLRNGKGYTDCVVL